MKTQYLCLPLLKATAGATTSTTSTATTTTSTSSPATKSRVRPPAASLLERFREAVFRLIMVTALSKTTNHSRSSRSSSSSSSTPHHHDYHNQSVRRSCYIHDPYPSEAVADCIEFIKKKSASSSPSDHDRHHDDHADVESIRDSTVTSDVVIPLPVI